MRKRKRVESDVKIEGRRSYGYENARPQDEGTVELRSLIRSHRSNWRTQITNEYWSVVEAFGGSSGWEVKSQRDEGVAVSEVQIASV